MSGIALYGGTFDPVHYGHLILAREALEQLALERIIFLPAAQSPHKMGAAPTSPALRLEMLRAAVKDEPHFSIDDRELRRPPPSFTIETAAELAREYPGQKLIYLIGTDNVAGLGSWHRIEDLRKLVEFVVLARGTMAVAAPLRVIRRTIEISATEIRKRVAEGRSIRYLVPPAVEEIIRRHQLYQDSHR